MRIPLPAALTLLLAAQAWACRDAPSPWEPEAEVIPPGARQLTFSPGHDRSPAWSIGSDSVLYVAEGYGDLARSDGVLVWIPVENGSVSPAFPIIQPPRVTAPALLQPAVQPGTGRIAYVQLLQTQGVCGAEFTSCDVAGEPSPLPPQLQSGRLRVRVPGATTPAADDPTLQLAFDGVTFDGSRHPSGLPGVWVTRLHPFQDRFNEMGVPPVRPAWEPGGGRIATSDGLRLLVWEPGEAVAQPIAGTEEGTSPAWSPDGARIAFARLDRGPEFRETCQRFEDGTNGPALSCIEERTGWLPGRSVVAVVPATGGEAIELVEGADPAWSPDGEWIYVTRPDAIWRAAVDGSVFARVDGTDGGTEPAPSPDGTALAFTRRGEDGKGDIWVVPLP